MNPDTTAQLRLEVLDEVAFLLGVGHRDIHPTSAATQTIDAIMKALADYISQLELPEKMPLEKPSGNIMRDEMINLAIKVRNRAIDDMAATLQRQAGLLRGGK